VDGRLHRLLQRGGVEAIAITGGETDVCVLATSSVVLTSDIVSFC
jgi:nicotinamidase-related amidase